MSKHAVPITGSKLKASTPVPDMIYGYNRHAAFRMSIENKTNGAANNQSLMYPFFLVEFKGDGPADDGLQCRHEWHRSATLHLMEA